jgi:hypothetical protein
MNENPDTTNELTYKSIWEDTNDLRWLFFICHLAGMKMHNELRQYCMDIIKYTSEIIPSVHNKPVEEDERFTLAELYLSGEIGPEVLRNFPRSFPVMWGDAGKMAKIHMSWALTCLTFEFEYTMFSGTMGLCHKAVGFIYKEQPEKFEEYKDYVSDEFKKRFSGALEKLKEDAGFTPEAIELLRKNGFYPEYTKKGWTVRNRDFKKLYFDYA